MMKKEEGAAGQAQCGQPVEKEAKEGRMAGAAEGKALAESKRRGSKRSSHEI
jgi:hypothetical protein